MVLFFSLLTAKERELPRGEATDQGLMCPVSRGIKAELGAWLLCPCSYSTLYPPPSKNPVGSAAILDVSEEFVHWLFLLFWGGLGFELRTLSLLGSLWLPLNQCDGLVNRSWVVCM
jgi:hypothetical protein